MMRCGNCNTPVDESLKYCPECGEYQHQPHNSSKYRVLPGINTYGEITSLLSLTLFVIPLVILSIVILSGIIIALPMDKGGIDDQNAVETTTPTETPSPENEEIAATTPTPTPESTPTPQPDDDDAYIEILQTNIAEEGITTEGYELVNNRPNATKILTFGFRTSADSTEEIRNEIETVTREVIYVIEQGWDIDEFVIVIGDQSGSAVGQVHIEEEWIQEYLEGEISKEELVERVLDSAVAY